MKGKLPNNFFYIKAKAERLLKATPEIYRNEDYFHYPLNEWNIDSILLGADQISSDFKGIKKSKCITMPDLKTVRQLMITFHFKILKKIKIDNEKNDNIYLVKFQHLTQKETRTELFFKIKRNQVVKNGKISASRNFLSTGNGKSKKTAYFFKNAESHEEAIQRTFDLFKRKNIKHLSHDTQKIQIINSKFIYDIHNTNQGKIWIKIPKPMLTTLSPKRSTKIYE